MRTASVAAIIDAWPAPSVKNFADELGEKPNTVSKWRNMGYIPRRRLTDVVNAAKKHGFTAEQVMAASVGGMNAA